MLDVPSMPHVRVAPVSTSDAVNVPLTVGVPATTSAASTPWPASVTLPAIAAPVPVITGASLAAVILTVKIFVSDALDVSVVFKAKVSLASVIRALITLLLATNSY